MNGHLCETCGTGLIDKCHRCGAPQCCPTCCIEATATSPTLPAVYREGIFGGICKNDIPISAEELLGTLNSTAARIAHDALMLKRVCTQRDEACEDAGRMSTKYTNLLLTYGRSVAALKAVVRVTDRDTAEFALATETLSEATLMAERFLGWKS